MKQLICPISSQKVNEATVRCTAAFTSILFALFAITHWWWILALAFADCFLRGFATVRYSPMSFAADKTMRLAGIQLKLIDKAPKVFASRICAFMAALALLFSFIAPEAALAIALIMLVLSGAEAVAGFCVGCVLYTYVVLPFFTQK